MNIEKAQEGDDGYQHKRGNLQHRLKPSPTYEAIQPRDIEKIKRNAECRLGAEAHNGPADAAGGDEDGGEREEQEARSETRGGSHVHVKIENRRRRETFSIELCESNAHQIRTLFFELKRESIIPRPYCFGGEG